MIDSFTTLLWFLLAITILVAIHEFGHFYVARRCGVKVLRFSIGFGKRLATWTDKHGTEFAVSAIPLGGYVKMFGERDEDLSDEEAKYSYFAQSPAKKIAIAFAGPLANFILAILLYWVLLLQGSVVVKPVIGDVTDGSLAMAAGLAPNQEIISVDGVETPSRKDVQLALIERLGETGKIKFVVRYWHDQQAADQGQSASQELEYETLVDIDRWLITEEEPNLLEGLGIEFFTPSYSPIIQDVVSDGAGFQAGLKAGDKLISIDGSFVDSSFDWVKYIAESPEKELHFVVERDQRELDLYITPQKVDLGDGRFVGRIGIPVARESYPKSMIHVKQYSVLNALGQSFKESWSTSGVILLSLKKLIVGEISTKSLSGPIGIAKVAADRAHHGFFSFLDFLAYLSLMLGVLNLLPIPMLDGGHILFSTIEWVKGSPVTEAVQNIGYQLGMVVVFGLMIIAFYNDILRL